ncbi:MAG: stage II sporulation protein R [Oscillibacter sp.]|nr:stage II sporulation protein R [Oscillibacter sp.]
MLPRTSQRQRDLLLAAGLFLLALFLNSGAAALRTQERLSDKIIRLHVLANSDTPEDQSVKLLVRDRILSDTAPLLERARTRAEMETLLDAYLPELADGVRRTLSDCGCACPVTLELRETEFPTRRYDTFALPAGHYLALRAVIGDGAGQNWWCVVFPPLCGAETVSGDFTAEEIGLIRRKNTACVLKFRAVECWERLRQKLRTE